MRHELTRIFDSRRTFTTVWGNHVTPTRPQCIAIFTVICLMMLTGAARANAVFASFQNADLQFNNTGTATTTGLFSASTPLQVSFEFHEDVTANGVTYLANQSINSTVTLTSAVADFVSGTRILDQPLKSGNLQFKDQFGNNLLTVSDFTGDITGIATGSTANLGTDTTLSSLPDIGSYSSDFLNFVPPNDVVASAGLTLELNGHFNKDADNYLTTFTANADGSFAGDAVNVPEPSALCFAGLTAMGLLLGRRRSRTAR